MIILLVFATEKHDGGSLQWAGGRRKCFWETEFERCFKWHLLEYHKFTEVHFRPVLHSPVTFSPFMHHFKNNQPIWCFSSVSFFQGLTPAPPSSLGRPRKPSPASNQSRIQQQGPPVKFRIGFKFLFIALWILNGHVNWLRARPHPQIRGQGSAGRSKVEAEVQRWPCMLHLSASALEPPGRGEKACWFRQALCDVVLSFFVFLLFLYLTTLSYSLSCFILMFLICLTLI